MKYMVEIIDETGLNRDIVKVNFANYDTAVGFVETYNESSDTVDNYAEQPVEILE